MTEEVHSTVLLMDIMTKFIKIEQFREIIFFIENSSRRCLSRVVGNNISKTLQRVEYLDCQIKQRSVYKQSGDKKHLMTIYEIRYQLQHNEIL